MGTPASAQSLFPCTYWASFVVTARVTVHIPSRNCVPSVGAEVGVDKLCLMALEFEVMPPPTNCYHSQVCGCERPCKRARAGVEGGAMWIPNSSFQHQIYAVMLLIHKMSS